MENKVLSLKRKRREGGNGMTQRDFLDFVIDGEPLSEKIRGDFVSCFAWSDEENAKAVNRLLLNSEADFPKDRRSLYVCPECGDLDCGAISAIIEESENKIIWRDFGYQNNYEDDVRFDLSVSNYSFTFDKYDMRRSSKAFCQSHKGPFLRQNFPEIKIDEVVMTLHKKWTDFVTYPLDAERVKNEEARLNTAGAVYYDSEEYKQGLVNENGFVVTLDVIIFDDDTFEAMEINSGGGVAIWTKKEFGVFKIKEMEKS